MSTEAFTDASSSLMTSESINQSNGADAPSALLENLNVDNELIDRRRKFGNWLRDCRRSARVTQAELAESLGYDSSQLISNIERGVSLLPSRRLPDFARVLGCSLLEMEVRYFQCSAKNTTESRMPDLLLKYLPVIEVLEYGSATPEDVVNAIKMTR